MTLIHYYLRNKTAREINDMKPQWELLFYSDYSIGFGMNLSMSHRNTVYNLPYLLICEKHLLLSLQLFFFFSPAFQ